MIEYLKTQAERMNSEQIGLVERMSTIEERSWQKLERERLTSLYLWLHMNSNSVAHRELPKKANLKA